MGKKVLAVASAGGHWQQLMLIRGAFGHHQVTYVTTLTGLAEDSGVAPAVVVPDCNRDTPAALAICALRIGWLVIRLRPDAVISTGALPGVLALMAGRVIGARTIWLDSVANAEEMSMSGHLARRVAHLWLSQWDHVARAAGAEYAGAVL